MQFYGSGLRVQSGLNPRIMIPIRSHLSGALHFSYCSLATQVRTRKISISDNTITKHQVLILQRCPSNSHRLSTSCTNTLSIPNIIPFHADRPALSDFAELSDGAAVVPVPVMLWDPGVIEKSPNHENNEEQGPKGAQDNYALKYMSVIHSHAQLEDSHTKYSRIAAGNSEKVSRGGAKGFLFIVWIQAPSKTKATATLAAPPKTRRAMKHSKIWGCEMRVFGPRQYQESGMCTPMELANPIRENRKE